MAQMISFGFGKKNKISVNSVKSLWASLMSQIDMVIGVYEQKGVMTSIDRGVAVKAVKDEMAVIITELAVSTTIKAVLNALVDILTAVLVDWIIKRLVDKGVITYKA